MINSYIVGFGGFRRTENAVITVHPEGCTLHFLTKSVFTQEEGFLQHHDKLQFIASFHLTNTVCTVWGRTFFGIIPQSDSTNLSKRDKIARQTVTRPSVTFNIKYFLFQVFRCN